MRSRNAVALLTNRPDEAQLAFYGEIARSGIDVFVVIDDNDFQWRGGHPVTPVQVDDRECADAGFRNLNPVITERTGRPASAWEKAIYYFARVEAGYDNVWMIEDDVLVSSPDAIRSMDRKYETAHIVSATNEVNATGELATWSWYQFIPEERMPLPWAHSLVCAVRLSRDVLRLVDEFLAANATFESDEIFPTSVVSRAAMRASRVLLRFTRGRDKANLMPKCFFIESLFHTIALHHGLEVATALELAGIVWQREWSYSEIERGRLYHPVKNIGLQERLRREILAHAELSDQVLSA